MRIVVTGATGFIGRELVQLLMDKGHQVCTLMRPESNRQKLAGHPVTLITYTSLKNQETVSQLKDWQPEVFIHLAWRGVGGKDRNAAFHISENIAFTLDAVYLAAAAGCTQWIGAGSQAEYGVPNIQVTEESRCMPVSAYGTAKLAAGIAALGMCAALRMKGAWCRVFSVYGPGDHTNAFVPYIINSFQNGDSPQLTACEQLWDYLYISDAAAAFLALAEKGATGIFNIGSGTTVSLQKIVEMLRQETGFNGAVPYGSKPYAEQQIMHLQADVSRLKQTTNWTPVVGLNEGLRQTVATHKLKMYQ